MFFEWENVLLVFRVACLKSFDRFEAVFDVFYDYLAWHWIALFLLCLCPILTLLPLSEWLFF